jgi:hypothetical protein
MNEDHFEQRLHRQRLRPVPAEWRREMLSAARSSCARPSTLDSRQTWLSTLNFQLSTILWPCPQAWVGLAAAWLVILALNFMTRDEPKFIARRGSQPPSPELQAALKEQRRLFVELAGLPAVGSSVRPRGQAPKPRSERPHEIKAV